MASLRSAFTYWRAVTFDTSATGANLSGDLTSFPVCVQIDSNDWAAGELTHFFADNASGKRCQFFDSDGTTNLDYEVEYSDGSGVAVYWVRVPTLTGGSTTDSIQVAYGNDPNASDQDNPTGVWDANFMGVWHLGDNSWGSSPEGKDSTSGAHHLTNSNTADAAGVVRRGRTIDGVDDYIDGPNDADLKPTAALTVEGWMNLNADCDDYGMLVDAYNGVDPNYGFGYAFGVDNATPRHARGFIGTSTTDYHAIVSTATLTNGTPTHAVMAWSSASGYLDMYTNGAVDATPIAHSNALVYYTDIIMRVGKIVTGATPYLWGGVADEIRISNVKRSADWVKATYWSMKGTNFPGEDWTTLGAEQGGAVSVAIFDHHYRMLRSA